MDFGEKKESPLLSLLQQSVFETNLFRKFGAIDILISALPDDIAEAVKVKVYAEPEEAVEKPENAEMIEVDAKGLKDWLNKHLLKNTSNKTKLEKISIMKDNTELAVEYLGQDYLTHPEYHYDKEFEALLNEMNFVVNHFIGLLIKKLDEGGKSIWNT